MMADRKVTRRRFVQTSAVAAAGVAAGAVKVGAANVDKKKILNYNSEMEYRPCGKTGMMVSAVCLGGHWKRINVMKQDFNKNRHDVVSRCIDAGINYIDACTIQEVKAYSLALKGRRDKMYLGCSWYQKEMRNGKCRTEKALLETLDWGLKDAGCEYADLWRITMHEQSIKHTEAEVEQMMKALEKAKKQGKARFIGLSSHHREHIKSMIETYPQIVDVIVTPYTAKTKEMPGDSLFKTLATHKVGFFGIKPFSSNRLFKGDSSPGNPQAEADDRLARLAIRYILCNPIITAPIPGLISIQQVDNVAKAVAERRKLDVAEAKELEEAMDEAWAKLPPDYQWLKDWEYV